MTDHLHIYVCDAPLAAALALRLAAAGVGVSWSASVPSVLLCTIEDADALREVAGDTRPLPARDWPEAVLSGFLTPGVGGGR